MIAADSGRARLRPCAARDDLIGCATLGAETEDHDRAGHRRLMIAFIVLGAVIATTIALISPVSAADAPKKTVDFPFSEDNQIDSQTTGHASRSIAECEKSGLSRRQVND